MGDVAVKEAADEIEERLDEQLDHWRKVAELSVQDPAFHTDPYSAARMVCELALRAAITSPNINETEIRNLQHVLDLITEL